MAGFGFCRAATVQWLETVIHEDLHGFLENEGVEQDPAATSETHVWVYARATALDARQDSGRIGRRSANEHAEAANEGYLGRAYQGFLNGAGKRRHVTDIREQFQSKFSGLQAQFVDAYSRAGRTFSVRRTLRRGAERLR